MRGTGFVAPRSMPASLPCELVIARYNEDISWSRDFTNCTLTTVYEKGEPLPTGHIEPPPKERHTD